MQFKTEQPTELPTEQPIEQPNVSQPTQPTVPVQPSDNRPKIIIPWVPMEIAGATDKQSSTPSANGVTQTSEAATHQVTVHSQGDKASNHQVNSLTTSSSAVASSSAVNQTSQSSVAAGNGTSHQGGQGQGLPQTGNSQSLLATIMGLITGSLSLLSLRKRHF